jgi:hypothetical protein
LTTTWRESAQRSDLVPIHVNGAGQLAQAHGATVGARGLLNRRLADKGVQFVGRLSPGVTSQPVSLCSVARRQGAGAASPSDNGCAVAPRKATRPDPIPTQRGVAGGAA